MANANKQKGDRAERAVRDWAVSRWPGSFKTRAGFNDDVGDVIATTPFGRLVLQVKDVAQPAWRAWFTQLAAQVNTCAKLSQEAVVGGVIVHKVRGSANPATWRAVTTLEGLAQMLEDTYHAGLTAGRAEARV